MHYYKFGNGWVKETIESGNLTRRLYTADPRSDKNAKLDSITEFDAETEDGSSRFREGHVMGDGHTQWGAWEPV